MRYLGCSCEGKPTRVERRLMVALHNQITKELDAAEGAG